MELRIEMRYWQGSKRRSCEEP